MDRAAERVVGVGMERMWAVLAKIKSLFALPLSFAAMLYQAIVQGAQMYAAEIWLPCVNTRPGWALNAPKLGLTGRNREGKGQEGANC